MITIEITYEKEDWFGFQNCLENEILNNIKTPFDNFWVGLTIWILIGFMSMFVFQKMSEFHWPSAIYVAVICVILFLLLVRHLTKMKNAFSPMDSGCFIGTHTYTITETGIESNGVGYRGHHDWSLVHKIMRANGLIILFIDTANAFIFPESKLEDPDAFYNYVNEYKK